MHTFFANSQRLFLLFFFLLSTSLYQSAAADGVEYDYRQAELSFKKLLKDPQKQKDRHYWLACIKSFSSVYTSEPSGPRADDAIFMIGRLYSKLYEISSRSRDRQEAVDYCWRLLKRFPKSPFRAEAKEVIAQLREVKKTAHKETGILSMPTNKGVAKSKPSLEIKKEPLEKKKNKHTQELLAKVTDLRFWSNPSYTRVVIDVDKEVPYTHRLLKKDPAIGKPQRLYIDVDSARMDANLRPIVPIGDDLLTDARAAQHTLDKVRVVLDIKSIDKFKIFSLKNPFRVVLDVNGIPKKQTSKRALGRVVKPDSSIPKGSLAKQLALGVKRIVIDAGHGGKDPGAVGYNKAVLEKHVTLEVAKRLAKKIREKLGCEAILTRDRDVFLSLEERTAIANTKNGDIFISIHTNSSKNRHFRGIETYFLNLATDHDAIMLAARENATSAKNISDLEAILNDLMKNAKVNESSRLAAYVQGCMVQALKPKYKRINDNGVKQAPFYVLLGAEMPCILVEIAFISNPVECRRLNSTGYQDEVADAIVVGMQNYIREISPAASSRFQEIRARM
jgi:N-acetylmuramoyl-L-alanine amidase